MPAKTRGTHTYWLRLSRRIMHVDPETMTGLPEGWRYVHHVEIADWEDPGDPELEMEPIHIGDDLSYWTLEIDALMNGPADRWEADREFRDLAEHFSGSRPGPGSGWSLRSAPRGTRR